MKPFFFFSVIALLLSSCSNKNSPGQNTNGLENKEALTGKGGNMSHDMPKGPEDFNTFYEKFHADKSFQLTRIKFPVEGSYNDFDTVMKWTGENWEYMEGTINKIDTVKYDIKFDKKADEVFEGIYCKECGFSFEARYTLLDGLWYLTYRMDNNF